MRSVLNLIIPSTKSLPLSSIPPTGGEKWVPILTLSTVPTVTVDALDIMTDVPTPTIISPIVPTSDVSVIFSS